MFFELLILFFRIAYVFANNENTLGNYVNQDEFNTDGEDSNYRMAKYLVRSDGKKEDTSKLGTFSTRPKESYPAMGAPPKKSYSAMGTTQPLLLKSKKRSAYRGAFNDQLWNKQWYAQDYRTTDGPVMDLNLVPVYRMGITGKGVTVAVVDNGVKADHPDLIANYDTELSYDTIKNVTGSQPESRYVVTPFWLRGHGTKCAGIIAMQANNSICGVGVAFNAKLVGVRAIGSLASVYSKSAALIHKLRFVDIYSSSWGPPDDGSYMTQMPRLINAALVKGIREGRGGKGAIYLFPGGNGKRVKDNCAADEMVNHPSVIGIAAATQLGKAAPYSEACTAIMATAYSGGNSMPKDGFVKTDEQVVSIDVWGGCSEDFSLTYAATPIAAGIIALTLEANGNLTYRDVMHLITMSAEVAPLASNDKTWHRNGAGFWVSNDFGFGLLNAENMVLLAQQWTNVPPKVTCKIQTILDDTLLLRISVPVWATMTINGCSKYANEELNFLEFIVLESTISHNCRGALEIKLTSPAETVSTLLAVRLQDTEEDGLDRWAIKSFHNWGEDPKGEWVIKVEAKEMVCRGDQTMGRVRKFDLYLHGTTKPPPHHRLMPRTYAAFTLPNGQTNLTPRYKKQYKLVPDGRG